jgi:hypothetical protein
MDMFDIEFPRFPMEDRPVFATSVLLLDHGFEAGVPQFIEVEVGGLWKPGIGWGWSGVAL